ncbi:glycosyltransferase [Candidatus Bathyarchaeota archaeon]|nr:glycosyltransferase [Candidatus Bathyarchaeota archaeon]
MEVITQVLVYFYFLFNFLLLPYGYNCFYMVLSSLKYEPPKLIPIKNHSLVTVQLPIYNEKHVADRLIISVCAMDWPKELLEILVLDDSNDETKEIVDLAVKKFRQEGYNIKVIRRENRVGYKAGALQNALQYTSGKYLAIIDADFIPPKDFLEKTVSAIEIDPKLGFVQARWEHLNRSYSAFTESIALAINGYHIVEQSARSAKGFLFNFNGSAGVLRTEAIKSAGGWAWDTLSEDLDISYRIQLNGWSALYLRDLTVDGEIPANLQAFRTQQGRWARGSVQCAKKMLGKVWFSDKSVMQKIEGTLHLTYYMISLWMFLGLIVTVLLLAFNKFPYITNPIFIALFSACTLSSFTLYYSTLRQQNISVISKLPYIVLLLFIGYGISAKASIEMIKGLIWSGGSYERVPKFNIIKKTDRISSSYNAIKSIPWMELFMLVYTILGIFFAYWNNSWGIMGYLFIYLMGYFTVVYSISVQ